MWREIKKVIHQNQNFLLTTHQNPDGDGVGAACALTELLILMGKNVRFVCDSPIPAKFSFLDYHQTHERYDPDSDYSHIDVMIILDTHKKERIGQVADLIRNSKMITICIDHHVPMETFSHYLSIDAHACSAGAMVYTLYKECGYDLDYQAATGVYTSVICDTGRFSYSSTSRKAHKIADECIKLGVDPDLMHKRLFQHVTLTQMRMFANALQRMETYLDDKVVMQQICCEDCEKLEGEILDIEHMDLEYIHEFNKLIEGVECVVLLREVSKDLVRVSARSASWNVGKVMGILGGGGHHNAAGVSWKGSLDEIKQRLLVLLTEEMESVEVHVHGV